MSGNAAKRSCPPTKEDDEQFASDEPASVGYLQKYVQNYTKSELGGLKSQLSELFSNSSNDMQSKVVEVIETKTQQILAPPPGT